jgi:hypothetical protein
VTGLVRWARFVQLCDSCPAAPFRQAQFLAHFAALDHSLRQMVSSICSHNYLQPTEQKEGESRKGRGVWRVLYGMGCHLAAYRIMHHRMEEKVGRKCNEEIRVEMVTSRSHAAAEQEVQFSGARVN